MKGLRRAGKAGRQAEPGSPVSEGGFQRLPETGSSPALDYTLHPDGRFG